MPSSGANTRDAINRAGTLIVEDPCTRAIVPSIPAPRSLIEVETGTMHAEQRFITGPSNAPLRVRPNGPPPDQGLEPGGNKNDLTRDARRKAKVMPIVTNLKYVTEKSTHLDTNDVSGSDSMQKPWKHSITGPVIDSKSPSTISSLGNLLKTKNRVKIIAKITIPARRFLARPELKSKDIPDLSFSAIWLFILVAFKEHADF